MTPIDRLPVRVLLPALYLAFATIAMVPLFAVETIPLDDYPNHLARMHILVEHARTPALQTFYDVRWAAFPNLAMELVVVPLAALVPVELAGRLFLAATLVLLVAGVAAVHRALTGRWSAWPAAAFLLLYNDTLLFGFVNYLFALGLALLSFAAWIALAAARRRAVPRASDRARRLPSPGRRLDDRARDPGRRDAGARAPR
ncbi:MAG: hypothetical protein FJX67_17525 [Alphaproteobacteria bacterium]|nr:hypothetical protein [Alphaproteobacteria bacterium]